MWKKSNISRGLHEIQIEQIDLHEGNKEESQFNKNYVSQKPKASEKPEIKTKSYLTDKKGLSWQIPKDTCRNQL